MKEAIDYRRVAARIDAAVALVAVLVATPDSDVLQNAPWWYHFEECKGSFCVLCIHGILTLARPSHWQ